MPPRPNLEQVLSEFGRYDWKRFTKVLKALPADVDPKLAAAAVLSFIREPQPSFESLGHRCQELPAPVIREVLGQLKADTRPHACFLREAVPQDAPDLELCAGWKAALQGIVGMNTTYGWGSKQRKAKYRAVANHPRLLQGIQTTAVACEQVPLDMLAVLTTDASEASLDALIPHVERAVQRQGKELDRLEELRTHAPSTPAMDELFARIQALLQARRARSPALDLARHLGCANLDTFWFRTTWSNEPRKKRGRGDSDYTCRITVDSRTSVWFEVWLARRNRADPREDWDDTWFDNERRHGDPLGVGTCELLQLPAWIGRAARHLELTWSFSDGALRTSLRGRKREQLAAWLRSAT